METIRDAVVVFMNDYMTLVQQFIFFTFDPSYYEIHPGHNKPILALLYQKNEAVSFPMPF